jgi:hypothetical protein
VNTFRAARVLGAGIAFDSGLLVFAFGLRALWIHEEYLGAGSDPRRAYEWLVTGIGEIAAASFLIVVGVGFLASRFRWIRQTSTSRV